MNEQEKEIARLNRELDYHIKMRAYEKDNLKDLGTFLQIPNETATNIVAKAITRILNLEHRNSKLIKELENVLTSLELINDYFDNMEH